MCADGVARNYRHYFYGGSPKVVQLLVDRLQQRHPGLIVAGHHSPPFRPLTEAEDAADTAADQPIESAEREPAGEVEEQEPALAASF